ncbi:protocadherin alpha-2-like isoform X3 [Hoplias malabaricus]|uniref:protocadherin alpha-2-like isoform X3 n=1 Tax=Hoplias malabaricus TaxID=27720 RepID=UPI0034630067
MNTPPYSSALPGSQTPLSPRGVVSSFLLGPWTCYTPVFLRTFFKPGDMVSLRGTGACVWILALVLLGLGALCRGQVSYSIPEEARKGSVVGNIAKDLGLAAHELDSRRFQFVPGPNAKYFEVSAKTGMLLVGERVDREELCESKGKCVLNVEVMLHSPHKLYRVEVNVLDVNDNSPVFPRQSMVLDVFENVHVGDRFAVTTARDVDVGNNAVKTYKMNPNEYFTLDAQNAGSPELVLQKALDREREAVIKLVVTALDGGSPARSGTLQVTVNVLDVNDNSPVFSQSLYKVKVLENAASGTKILTVSALDSDEGVNSEVLYSIISEEEHPGVGLFSINPITGDISVTGSVDYEQSPAVELRIQAQDKGTPPRRSRCKVLVEVTDVNDNAPEISVTLLMSSVSEDIKPGADVALITVSDKDDGKNGKVSFRISGHSPFQLQPSYKNSYSLVVSEKLDREQLSQHHVMVVANDEGSPSLSSTGVITVHVSDVNDNPPLFPAAVINIDVKENSPAGERLTTLTATDLDTGENAHVSYSLLDLEGSSTPVSTLMNINSLTGEVYTLQSFNYETIKRLRFQVQATDSGSPPLSSNVSVSVFVLDENDNSPVLLAPYSEASSVSTESVPYSAEAGYFVAKVRAVDADCGYNALLSYHLTEAKGTNLFRIGSNSGEIRTKRRMSDNDLKSHALVVTVSDHGEPSLSATASVEVVVVESVERVQPSLRQVPLKEEAFSDLNLYLLIAIVSVSGLFLLSLAALAAARCCGSGGALGSCGAPVVTAHPDGSWSYSKATQQYDVCFSSDTLKSDVVVFPSPFPPPADAELISINGGDTFTRGHTLTSAGKMVRVKDNSLLLSELGSTVTAGASVMEPAPGMAPLRH